VQSIWQSGVLDPQGPIGAAEKLILINATVVMLAVVVPVIVLTLGFAWWFRAGNAKARYLPDWEYSGPIELLVWAIPALVVMFLAGIAWIGTHDLDPPKPLASQTRPLEIQVVSLDWKWLFIYPEQGIASVNRLPVPIGTPLHFSITSASVMNSFFVPQLGSQIYAMGGMTTRLVLQADNPGTFVGRSVQFSGAGFSDMRFDVVALPPAAFEDWVKQTRGAGGTLDAANYARLVRPSIAVPPATFGTVMPRMFEAAIHATVR
jgi:cytochrome o ubiquinol oxidase subunit 2